MTVLKKKKKLIGKAWKTSIAFDEHWHSQNDNKCQQEPETKNKRKDGSVCWADTEYSHKFSKIL